MQLRIFKTLDSRVSPEEFIRGISLRPGGRGWYSPIRIWKDVSCQIPLSPIEIAYPEDPKPFRSFGAKQLLVPYGIMRDWLYDWGLPECEVRALIEAKKIRAPPGTHGWRRFSVTQIKRDVLEPALDEKRLKRKALRSEP
jgi:hypothetical protein